MFSFILVAVLYLFGCFAPYRDTYFALVVINAFVGLSVYYAGYLYRRFESKVPMHWLIALSCVIMLVVNSGFGSIELSENEYGSPWFFLASALMGIYANIYLAKIIAASSKSSLLDAIGKNTITIMALHVLSFKAIHLVQIYLNSYDFRALSSFPILDGSQGWWIAYSAAGIVIPFLIKYCFDSVRGGIGRRRMSRPALSQ